MAIIVKEKVFKKYEMWILCKLVGVYFILLIPNTLFCPPASLAGLISHIRSSPVGLASLGR